MKKKIKVLALFDAIRPTKIDQDLSKEMKTEDWKTEANVLAALGTLGHPTEHLAIFDNLDLLRQKLESFAPDVIFNLADQFKNNRAFDQHIVSLLAMQGMPFTGCGSTVRRIRSSCCGANSRATAGPWNSRSRIWSPPPTAWTIR